MGLAFGHGADYRHHSNLLFVENDKDPWQIGTESVASGGSVRRFVAAGGAHHQDLRFPSPLDAPGVSAARRVVEETVRGWLELNPRGSPARETRHNVVVGILNILRHIGEIYARPFF